MKVSIILFELLKVYLISPPPYFMKQYILHIKFLEYVKIQTTQNTKPLSYSICATTTEPHRQCHF